MAAGVGGRVWGGTEQKDGALGAPGTPCVLLAPLLMLSELLNQSKGISLLGCILQKREGRTRGRFQRCPRGLRAACPPLVLAQAVRAVPRCSQQRWGRIGEGHD